MDKNKKKNEKIHRLLEEHSEVNEMNEELKRMVHLIKLYSMKDQGKFLELWIKWIDILEYLSNKQKKHSFPSVLEVGKNKLNLILVTLKAL